MVLWQQVVPDMMTLLQIHHNTRITRIAALLHVGNL